MNLFARKRALHLAIGRRGEAYACRLLEAHRHEILARDWRCRKGELDIVARDGATLVFVEVKTRARRDTYRPADNLSRRQLGRNRRAAAEYIRQFNAGGYRVRFDLIEVICTRFRLIEIRRLADFAREDAR